MRHTPHAAAATGSGLCHLTGARARESVRPLDSVAIIREVFAAFARRDLEGVLEHLHPDVEFHAPTADIARGGEPYRGLEGLREYFGDVERLWEELRLSPVSFEEIDGGVLVTGRVWARGSGRVIDSPAGWIWRLDGGRVRYLRAFTSIREAEEEAVGG